MCVCVLFFVSIVLLNWLFNVKWLFVEPDCLEYATHLIVSTHCCEVFSKLLCFRRWLRFETFFCGLLWRHWCDAFVVWRHWCYFIGVTPLVLRRTAWRVVGVTSLQWHHWCVTRQWCDVMTCVTSFACSTCIVTYQHACAARSASASPRPRDAAAAAVFSSAHVHCNGRWNYRKLWHFRELTFLALNTWHSHLSVTDGIERLFL